MTRRRIGVLLAASAVASAVALGSASGAAGAKAGAVEREWTGTTSKSAGIRDLSFETLAVRTKKGKRKEKLPYLFKRWGMGAPLTCTGTEAPFSGYQLFPGYVGVTGNVDEPGQGRGGKVKVRKGRFSVHGVYDVSVYFIPKRIEYKVTGRFSSPRKAAGTLQVSTLWSHPDGTQTSCVSGPLTWSACALYVDSDRGPACAGIDPQELEPDDETL